MSLLATLTFGLAAIILPVAAASAPANSDFLCPVPVIPAHLGPSNACCSKLIEIPLSELVNPEDGPVYWGINCTAATVKQNIGDGSTQAVTYPCPAGTSSGCCDPSFRKYLGSGPCVETEKP